LVSDDQDPPGPPQPQDVVMIHSPLEEGDGFHVVRLRESEIEVGEIRTLREGAPVHGEVVRLVQRKEHERLFNVEVLVDKPKTDAARERSGPAQVATNAYRTNWEMIFGPRKESDALN
jgi:hypothetical protein